MTIIVETNHNIKIQRKTCLTKIKTNSAIELVFMLAVKEKVIRIEIETMKTAVSELQRKRAILSYIKERMAKLAYAVSQQSYVEETVCELRKLKKRMGEIEENLRDLQEALEEICILIEKTEEKKDDKSEA